MIKTSCTSRSIIALLLLSAVSASAQTPLDTAFTYQGQLKDGGSPANGLHDLRFRLYDAAVGGTQVGPTLCVDNVSVTDGLFTVSLDFGAQFAGEERFLEIDVRADTGLDCSNPAGFVLLTPRQALTAAPNALFALNADRLDGLDSSAFLQSIPVPLTLSGTSARHIIRGENASTTPGASGVLGLATGATGTTYGVYGLSVSTFGTGVFGNAISSSGGTYGVYGLSASTGGRGVYGNATASSGITYGGRFESASTSGTGVLGWATNNSGTNYGVVGRSNSTAGYDFFADGAGVNYGSGSSIRWKRNIEVIDRPLEKLFRLRGVYFDWDAEHGGHHDVGMIAEEVGAVLPEIVNYEENGTDAHGMDYSKLTPLLVEAVKELHVKVEEKDAQIAALRAEKDKEIAELKVRLERLDAAVQRLVGQNLSTPK